MHGSTEEADREEQGEERGTVVLTVGINVAIVNLLQDFHMTTFSGQAVQCTVPNTWNSLPNIVTAAGSLASFISKVNTHVLNQTFRPTFS